MKEWNEKAIEITDLSVYYNNRRKSIFEKKSKIQALKNVSLPLYKGEVLGLVGESGSGKSTLARAIMGINKDYTGTIIKTD